MSDPDRLLLDAEAGSFERAMLEAWHDDKPSALAREKTLAALGLATGAAAGAVATGSIAPKAIAMTTAALLKWLGLAVVILGIATMTAIYVHGRSTAPELPSVLQITAPPVPAPTHVDMTPAPPASVSASLEIESPPVMKPTATSSVAPHSLHSNAHPAQDDLAPQIALLDHARAALASGDAPRAKTLAERYEAEFPGGTFAQEAEVLRIEALLGEGDRDGATRAGKHFLELHPTSPHASHVREILSL